MAPADLTAARRAAAALPGWRAGARDPDMSERERSVLIAFCLAVFVGLSAWIFVTIWGEELGWLLVLAGLPAWLAVRFAFFRMRGSQTGVFAVDDRGVIHVVSGRHAVRRLTPLFDKGAERWLRHSVAGGLLIGVLGPFALAVLCVVLDSPAPAAVFLTGAGFAMLDFVRFMAVVLLWPRVTGQRRLDSTAMLPALALYARHHGWRAATSGVPADHLADTLAAHPDEVRTAETYAAGAAALSRVAATTSAASGAAGTV